MTLIAPPPAILSPPGIRPPEIHADRIVAAMVKHVIEVRAIFWENFWQTWRAGSFGNPIGQQRAVRRLKTAGGPFLVDCHLVPGRRAKFELMLSMIAGYNPDKQEPILAFDGSKPLPAKPCLCVLITQITGRRHATPKDKSGLALIATHHSLSRLCQRVGARTPQDLVAAVAALFEAVLDAGLMPDHLPKPPAGKQFPVTLPGGMGHATAVLVRHDDPEIGSIVVATLWDNVAPPTTPFG